MVATGKISGILVFYEMARALGRDQCDALPLFHGFIECNTVSHLDAETRRLHGTPGKLKLMKMSPHYVVPKLAACPTTEAT